MANRDHSPRLPLPCLLSSGYSSPHLQMLLPVVAANNINLFHSDDKTTIYNIDFIVGFIKNNDLMQVSCSRNLPGSL
jgi:hypothetical protein